MALSELLDERRRLASRLRSSVIELSHRAETPHLGSSLSCIDIIATLYSGILNISPANAAAADRDRFILSKGHAATALYSCLCFKGFFDSVYLDRYAQPGAVLAEQPSPGCLPGVEAATGSLGHGLSLAIGMAMAAKIQQQTYKVYALLSDGECNEGSVWEAAMFAPMHKLENLVAIVDYNKWQATGRSEEVLSLSPLKDKWTAFGWSACEVDGHNLEDLDRLLTKVPDGSTKPIAIIAHTVKGKGVSFMEDDNNWHYRIPNKEEVDRAKVELGV